LKTIKKRNIDSGTVKRTLSGHTDFVYGLILVANGDLVSGFVDKIIKIWNVEDGTIIRT
jgi:WD40 repeat protein